MTDEAVSDIEIALTEACTNVVDHSGAGDEYEVSVEIDPDACVIRVIDSGEGFDAESSAASPLSEGSEHGRGIQLMKALVDRVQFVSKDDNGTIVHLEKRLAFGAAAPMRRFAGGAAAP